MPNSGSRGALSLSIDTKDLNQIYKDLKEVEGNLRVEMRKGIKVAIEPVKAAVIDEASWSSRIPGAVKTKVSFNAKSAGASVYVDSDVAPEAAPINNRDHSGSFRHPVFGDRETWTNQQARPFMQVALRAANGSQVAAAIDDVIDAVIRKAGFS